MRRITLITMFLVSIFLLAGCGSSGQGVGSYLGIPAFMIDPLLNSQVVVDDRSMYLDLRELYVFSYIDESGAVDDSLWVFFVKKGQKKSDIVSGNVAPSVIIRIKDASNIPSGGQYTIEHDLSSSNFMVWMFLDDGKSAYKGDTIELNIKQISQTQGATIEGKFNSTLSRGSSMASAVDFRFSALVEIVQAPLPVF